MRKIPLGVSGLQVPVIGVGFWRLHKVTKQEAEVVVKTALENGANFFDHANVYGGGECESIFADAVGMKDDLREKMILQSKCGIVPGVSFDFSAKNILSTVEGSLKRLKTDYLDALLLHRPDALMEPEEVAKAFDTLHSSGKVRHFGVSNQTPMQIQLLQKFVKQPIVANQLQLSITQATMITQGIYMNSDVEGAVMRDGSVLDFCRLKDITIQPWSPFQFGFNKGTFLDNPAFPELNNKLNQLAEKYKVTNTAIALAWILRHPAHMQPIIGTMNPQRIKDCVAAADITLTREEWYEIYLAAGHKLP